MKLRLLCVCILLALTFQFVRFAVAQDTQPEPRKFLPPVARVAAAKTIFLRNVKGMDTAFNVIQAGFESWPHFTIVDSPEKADLILEVVAPEELKTNNSVSGSSSSGRRSNDTSDDAQFAPIPMVTMTVLDSRTKVTLYRASERTKNAWKEKNRTDSQIEVAQRIFDTFRKRVEQETTKSETK